MRSDKIRKSVHVHPDQSSAKDGSEAAVKRRHGTGPREIEEFPIPQFTSWAEPSSFHEALSLHMRRHGDTASSLARAITLPGERIDKTTMRYWAIGEKMPRNVRSLEWLTRIERRYRLPEGYFKAMLQNPDRAATGHHLPGVSPAERRRLAWHLPDQTVWKRVGYAMMRRQFGGSNGSLHHRCGS